jgi:hypothetical protein
VLYVLLSVIERLLTPWQMAQRRAIAVGRS